MPDLWPERASTAQMLSGTVKYKNAIDQQRRRLDGRALVRLESPGESEIPHVLRRDLSQRAVTSAGIIAVIRRPTVGRWMKKHLVIGSLRQHDTGRSRARSVRSRQPRNASLAKFISIRYPPRLRLAESEFRASATSANTPSDCGCRRRCISKTAPHEHSPAGPPCIAHRGSATIDTYPWNR